jgi:hypothetical protein
MRTNGRSWPCATGKPRRECPREASISWASPILSATFEKPLINELSEPVAATPALAGSRIYIRGNEYLYCIDAGR